MRIDEDPYLERYAQRARSLQASEIRALFAVASRPEVVSFAGGMPETSALDFEAAQEVARHVLQGDGPRAMQYGAGQGLAELREQLVAVMQAEGVPAHADDLVITSGGQQGLDLVTKAFVDPGQTVIAEGPTYVGALGAFRAHEAKVRHVAMDDEGLIPAALEEELAQTAAAGTRCEFLYVIPNHQNPAGVSLSAARREALADMAEQHDLIVLEDNPYGLLSFDGKTMPSLRSLIPDRVVYVGTVSKIFAPGVRTGWVAAPRHVRDKLIQLREASDLCPPNFTQLVVANWLSQTSWEGQVEKFRSIYAEKAKVMLAALDEFMPEGVTWTTPAGGFYVWVTLPEGLSSRDLLPSALQRLVAFVPGSGFYADGAGTQNLRLCFSHPAADRIREGVERLAAIITDEIRLTEELKL